MADQHGGVQQALQEQGGRKYSADMHPENKLGALHCTVCDHSRLCPSLSAGNHQKQQNSLPRNGILKMSCRARFGPIPCVVALGFTLGSLGVLALFFFAVLALFTRSLRLWTSSTSLRSYLWCCHTHTNTRTNKPT